MKRTQAGMTLIELVIVIIVLGIIAAVAAPKFADISTQAGAAAIAGNKGAFSSGLTIAIARAGGLPTDAALESQIDGFDCTTTLATCVTTNANQDLDNDGNADLSYALFEGAGICATPFATTGNTITGYILTENGAAASCVNLN